ncbi:MAG: TonB-dependent receptor family protein, partial [Bacteroidia bacterium]|nr:TonB-dependent receptor family protein [Bacteroidia bacterium]
SGRVNKISMNARYGTFNGYDWDSETYDRSYKANDTTAINMHNYIYTKYQFLSTHYYSGGIDYKVDSVTTISAAYNGFHNLGRNVVTNENTISENAALSSELSTATETKPLRINNNGNFSFLRKLDTLGSELFFASQYGQFSTNSISEITQAFENNLLYNQQQKRNRSKSDIKLITAQLDYTKHFNKKIQLDLGVKESFVKREGELNLENFSNGVWLTDARYFSGFNFSENIIAGYAEARCNSGKINLRAGLRAEHTDTYGFSRTLDSVVADRNYFNVFPSAFVGYNFTKEITMGLNYSSRIHRPSYQDMDPFINYIDSLSSIRGNPFLKPEYTTSMEANLVYNKEVTLLTFGYTRTNGTIKVVVDKLTDGSSGFAGINKNLNYSEMFSIGTTLPYENKWLTTGTYIGYNWNTFNYNSGGEVVTSTKPMLYIYMYSEIRFKKSFTFEMEGEYIGSGNDGIFNINPNYYINAGIKKKLFKDNLTLRFVANDIFATYQEWGTSNVPGFEIKFKSLRNMSNYVVMLNYRFGKMTNQEQRSKAVNQDEFNRIKMGK